jgi:hypothetical protein
LAINFIIFYKKKGFKMIDHGNYKTITIKEFVKGGYLPKYSEKSGGSSVKAGA